MATLSKMNKGHDALLHASAIPITPGVATLDASGIQMYEWSTPLKEPGDSCGGSTESRYMCCGCFALAQVESRMGIASSSSAVAAYGFTILLPTIVGAFVPWFIYGSDGLNLLLIWLWCGTLLLFQLTIARWWARRMATARTKVREQFQIPGSMQEDRELALWQPSRILRQMVRHLKCEDAGKFDRVDTLPAYHQ